MEIIFDSLEFEDVDEKEIIFDDLFNNEHENKSYVLVGTIGLWYGKRRVHHPDIFTSLKEAILTANDGFDGYICVTEESYGKLMINISHHDGSNSLEIRELTTVGEDMYNNYKEVGDILKRKGATRNVKYIKNRWYR